MGCIKTNSQCNRSDRYPCSSFWKLMRDFETQVAADLSVPFSLLTLFWDVKVCCHVAYHMSLGESDNQIYGSIRSIGLFRCSSYSAKHLLLLFGFFFFLGVRATARNTYCYCSVFFFFFFFFFLLLLLLPLRPIDCRQKNTYLQTSHELETWHVLRT